MSYPPAAGRSNDKNPSAWSNASSHGDTTFIAGSWPGYSAQCSRPEEVSGLLADVGQRETGVETWLVPVIIAENWHPDQIDHIREITDELVFIDANPNAIETLPTDAADRIGTLILRVLGAQPEG